MTPSEQQAFIQGLTIAMGMQSQQAKPQQQAQQSQPKGECRSGNCGTGGSSGAGPAERFLIGWVIGFVLLIGMGALVQHFDTQSMAEQQKNLERTAEVAK